ncbi:hypothetical protein SNEBB_010332, partial [Seison nebaliae]
QLPDKRVRQGSHCQDADHHQDRHDWRKQTLQLPEEESPEACAEGAPKVLHRPAPPLHPQGCQEEPAHEARSQGGPGTQK